MKIITETSLENFEAWSGAVYTLDTLIEKDLCDRLENIIENDIFPEGCTDTQLNDFLWFEDNYIAELLGYKDWEDLENDDEEEEEEEVDDDEEEIDYKHLNESIKNKVDFKTYCDNGDCDTCPFNNALSTIEQCEKAYNMMVSLHSFEEAIANA